MNARQAFPKKLSTLLELIERGAHSRLSQGAKPNAALMGAIAHAWNIANRYECDAAIDLSIAILSDANCHGEARALQKAREQFI